MNLELIKKNYHITTFILLYFSIILGFIFDENTTLGPKFDFFNVLKQLTLFEENLSHNPLVRFSRGDIKWPLLFDPQTSGGLLASIPEKDVNIVVRKLNEHGFCSSVVGEFVAGRPEIKVN